MENLYALDEVLDSLNETTLLKDYEDRILNEYAGNPEVNQAFRDLSKSMTKNLSDYKDEILGYIEDLNKITDVVVAESKKKTPDVKKAIRLATEIYNNIDDKLRSNDYKKYVDTYNNDFKKLKSVCRTFGIKYNDVIVVEKKEFDKTLEKAYKDIWNNAKVDEWYPTVEGTPKRIAEYNKAIDALLIEDRENARAITAKLHDIYVYGYRCVQSYCGNINFIRKNLKLNKINGPIYNMVNAIFKTKKKDK